MKISKMIDDLIEHFDECVNSAEYRREKRQELEAFGPLSIKVLYSAVFNCEMERDESNYIDD